MEPLVLTVPEAAPLLRCSVDLLYDAIRSGELEEQLGASVVLHLGRRVLLSRPALERALGGGAHD